MSLIMNWAPIVAIIIPNIGGLIGAFIVVKNLSWFESLIRPSWCPPNWIFGPVWTLLYTIIGYASYMIYKDGGEAKWPLILYGINIVLNWAWTPIFFGAHNLKLASLEIILVALTAIGATFLFYQVNPLAGLMFVPYLLWLAVASALSWSIYFDNPSDSAQSKINESKED